MASKKTISTRALFAYHTSDRSQSFLKLGLISDIGSFQEVLQKLTED